MDRYQLAGYRGGRIGSAPPFAYGGRDPISQIRGGGLPLPNRGPGIGVGGLGGSPLGGGPLGGIPLGGGALGGGPLGGGGLGGFNDPFPRRRLRGGLTPGGGLATPVNPMAARMFAGPGIHPLGMPLRPNIDPLLALAPVRRNSAGLGSFLGSYGRDDDDCDVCRNLSSGGGHHNHGLGHNCSSSGGHGYSHDYKHDSHPHHKLYNEDRHRSNNSSKKSDFDFSTKDIAVRGKNYAVRISYLNEVSKFEADLIKYVDKKSRETVPDRVIEMLMSFINREYYENESALDEVTLHVLAHSVTAKSACAHSLVRLKKHAFVISAYEMSEICMTVLCSDKVDDKLKDWLKEYLDPEKYPERVADLSYSDAFMAMAQDYPEVQVRLQELLGLKKAPKEDNHRVL